MRQGPLNALGARQAALRTALGGSGAAGMSTAMNFGSKSFQPRPPDKGSFPLDHFGEGRRWAPRDALLGGRRRAAGGRVPLPRRRKDASFPVPGECEHFKERFLKCLRDRRFENALCRNESRDYLQCRMDRRVPAGPAAGSAASRQAAGRVGGRRGNLVLSGICIPQRIFFPNRCACC